MNLNRRKSIILVSIILVLLAIVFVQAARYYHDTYVTEVGYAKAPAHVPKKEKTEVCQMVLKDSFYPLEISSCGRSFLLFY
ncbi:hypothetical protein [Leuconostoc mesenteroides]|uniref:hypothetical protein n=1 Tax=Leuconostoc mesenteroides TaxID=1245 RepID=UPI002360313B|nr:hypothetical protein [Leuconostoc mesenteroides]